MDLLLIDTKYRETFAQLGLTSCKAVTKSLGEPERPPRKVVLVTPVTLGLSGGSSLAVFYKQYEYEAGEWRFIGRPSKARCEFHNYAVFRDLGIACPDRVACGEQRDRLGRLRRSFVITTAIPQAWTLPQFLEKHCPNRATLEARQLRASISRQLATMTRCIHSARFFHNDLYLRNILVTWQPPAPPKVWWIDCPRGRFARFRTHRLRLKDLAALDKMASELATRRERVTFMKEYLGRRPRDRAFRQLASEILDYRKRRWPDEWH